jgi:phosphopantothenoylcysteine decarboxylase/phosphopantothenate--cysteine ligase
VVNRVGPDRAFGTPDNAATVLGADGSVTEVSRRAKEELADAVWDLVLPLLPPDLRGLDTPHPGLTGA